MIRKIQRFMHLCRLQRWWRGFCLCGQRCAVLCRENKKLWSFRSFITLVQDGFQRFVAFVVFPWLRLPALLSLMKHVSFSPAL